MRLSPFRSRLPEAKQAEQRAITIGKQGEANAAEAKWKQEVVRSTEVTMAQKDLDVADLAVKTAEKVKQAKILQGQGEAAARQLIMAADGGLDKKLEAYKYALSTRWPARSRITRATGFPWWSSMVVAMLAPAPVLRLWLTRSRSRRWRRILG